ncbi:MAG TPA: septum formation initiator family protein [Candidatus Eremiobacteraeota bacterium]|nr:septum formation initiator family protein [Candidatus Eremiobacteraeota bacterium]
MKQKSGKKKLYYTIIIISIFILLAGNIILIYYRDSQQVEKMDDKIAQVQIKIDLLREENLKLRRQSEKLQNGQYIEKIAREELGMVKKDEMAIIEIDNLNNERTNLKKQEVEKVKQTKKTPNTIELSKKSVEEFFDKVFNTISIKKE